VSDDQRKRETRTTAATASHYVDVNTGGVVPPLQSSTTFARDDRYELLNPAHTYSRDRSPAIIPAERVIADLEGGGECLLFPSGMAAVAAIFRTRESRDHVIAPASMYWGTRVWLEKFCERRGVSLTLIDDGKAQSYINAIRPLETSLLWVETPSNPLMNVTDIKQVAAAARDAEALVAVDNTAATPLFTRPLELGADIVMHSATKSLNGHSDTLAGAVVMREDNEVFQRIREERSEAGAMPGTFEAWLLLRGMRTFAVRVERAAKNAQQIAEFLNSHPAVESVRYPGLPHFEDHEISKRQMVGGFGSLLSFHVKGGAREALAAAGAMQLITSATSIGGVETLVEHRHSLEPEHTGVPVNLLRLSTGIEDVADLVEDLDQALGKAVTG